MTKQLLSEATAVPTKAGNGRWKSVLITPGQGSSGYYSEDVLREYGPKVLRKGAKSFVTHNRTENGEPDPFAMWGFLAEDSHYEDGVGLVGVIEVLPSWRERVEEVAPHTALSVYVCGELDDQGNVTSLVEDIQNGVDLVAYPGRPGSALVEQMIESATAQANKATATAAEEEKGNEMELEKVVEAVEALTAQVSALVADKKNAEADKVQAEADATAVAEALASFKAAVKAVDEADLLEVQRESILEAAERGEDITKAIESAKAVKEAAEKAATERLGEAAGQGRDFGGAGTETKFGAWK